MKKLIILSVIFTSCFSNREIVESKEIYVTVEKIEPIIRYNQPDKLGITLYGSDKVKRYIDVPLRDTIFYWVGRKLSYLTNK